jgi:AraC-like DNA-binding protein
MPAVAALLDRRPALLALRRALPRATTPVRTARTPAHLAALLHEEPVDAVILGAEAARSAVLDALRADYASLPVVVYATLRSDEAPLLQRVGRHRVAALLVEGLDEPVLARQLALVGLTARRLARLLPLGERAGLVDPLQQRAWRAVVERAPEGLDGAGLARHLKVGRPTLVRRFAAGSAPPLKRAMDLVRLVAAAQLLGSRALTVADVARLLGFSSPSLLHRTSRRLFGAPLSEVVGASDAALLAALRGPRTTIGWR